MNPKIKQLMLHFVLWPTVALTREWALTCDNHSGMTKACAEVPFSYSCNANGNLVQYGEAPNYWCDKGCRCDGFLRRVATSSMLEPAGEGKTDAVPSGPESVTVEVNSVRAQQEPTSADEYEDASSEGHYLKSMSRKVTIDTVANRLDPLLQSPQTAPSSIKRHHWALSCHDDYTATSECHKSPYQYHCNAQGRLEFRGREEELVCGDCLCINLFSETNCSKTATGDSVCVDIDYYSIPGSPPSIETSHAIPNDTLRDTSNTTSTTASLTTRPPSLAEREVAVAAVEATVATTTTYSISIPRYNNFAMNCFDEVTMTQSCQMDPYKYYCNSFGQLRRQGKREGVYCDLCECIDLFPKPQCMFKIMGMEQCARDLHTVEVLIGDYEGVAAGVGIDYDEKNRDDIGPQGQMKDKRSRKARISV